MDLCDKTGTHHTTASPRRHKHKKMTPQPTGWQPSTPHLPDARAFVEKHTLEKAHDSSVDAWSIALSNLTLSEPPAVQADVFFTST